MKVRIKRSDNDEQIIAMYSRRGCVYMTASERKLYR